LNEGVINNWLSRDTSIIGSQDRGRRQTNKNIHHIKLKGWAIQTLPTTRGVLRCSWRVPASYNTPAIHPLSLCKKLYLCLIVSRTARTYKSKCFKIFHDYEDFSISWTRGDEWVVIGAWSAVDYRGWPRGDEWVVIGTWSAVDYRGWPRGDEWVVIHDKIKLSIMTENIIIHIYINLLL
jgi:hypothetical protein